MSLFWSHFWSLPSVILKAVKITMQGGGTMKRNIRNLNLILGQLDRRHMRLGLVVLTLVLFVLGAGAPAAGGGY